MTDNLERRDLVDKANAWDAIAAKNAEITLLQEALAAAEAERDDLREKLKDPLADLEFLFGLECTTREQIEGSVTLARQCRQAVEAAEAEVERLLPIEAEAAEGREINGELRALLAETRKKALEAALRIAPYLIWTIGEESPGHHPTMPSAVAAFLRAFDIDTPEKRRAADHAALHEFLKADEAPK